MIEVFRAGKHTDNRGVTREFTEEMLQEIVDSYDPKLHRAPILTNHDESQPSQGWIERLVKKGKRLFAVPGKVVAEFKEAVNNGQWASISSRLYHPKDPHNPVPDKWGYRHASLVHAAAVKGMDMPEFSEHPDWDVELCFSEISFSGWLDGAIASVFRNLRDWFIEKEGLELADRLLPSYLIEQMAIEPVYEQMREIEQKNEPTPLNYSEGGKMTEEEINARLAEIEKREAAIATRERTIQLIAEFSEWIEPLVADGKVLPAEKAKHVATLVAASLNGETKVEFGEGSEAQSISLVEAYKQSLEARTKIVEYSEQGKNTGDPNYSSGTINTDLAMKARALVEKRKREDNIEISFTEAVKQLGGRN